MGATRAGEIAAHPMKPSTSDFRATTPPRGDDRGRRGSAERHDEVVSPVISDATGVRDGGVRGRVDATRPRRRYITH